MDNGVKSAVSTVGGNKFPLIFNPEKGDSWVDFHSMVVTIACAYPELRLAQVKLDNGCWAVVARYK